VRLPRRGRQQGKGERLDDVAAHAERRRVAGCFGRWDRRTIGGKHILLRADLRARQSCLLGPPMPNLEHDVFADGR